MTVCDRCPVCGKRATNVEHNSRAFDPNRQGIGSSALLGARYNTFLEVPQDRTASRTQRYLFQLACMGVPNGWRATVTSLWQGLYIGAYPLVVALDEDDTTKQLVEIPVTDPAFAFPDGNTCWSLLFRPGRPYNDALYDPVSVPGAYPGLRSPESGILYIPPYGTGDDYVPPAAGDPGGNPIGSLTGFTHLRNFLPGQYPALFEQVDGPGTIVFVVSLWQTDPETRIIWAPRGGNLQAFTREQQFIWQMDLNDEAAGTDAKARYTHVGGGFTAQVRPLCCDEGSGKGPGRLSMDELRASILGTGQPQGQPQEQSPSRTQRRRAR